MKLIAFLLVIVFYINSFSQNNIPTRVILKNNEIIEGMMTVRKNMFDKTFIYVTSFYKEVNLIQSNGTIKKLKAEEILELYFTDLNGIDRKFIKTDAFKNLIEELYNNKVKCYKIYNYNFHNQSEDFYYQFIDEKSTLYEVGIFNSLKKKLKEFTHQNPRINRFINDHEMYDDKNIKIVLSLYEETLAQTLTE